MVEPFVPDGAAVTLDAGVVPGLAGLDMLDGNPMFLGLFCQLSTDVFRAIACWERRAAEGYGRLRSPQIAQRAAITGLRSLWWFCEPRRRGDWLWPELIILRMPAFW